MDTSFVKFNKEKSLLTLKSETSAWLLTMVSGCWQGVPVQNLCSLWR